MSRLARLRVPLGFLSGAVAYALSRPTPRSVAIGLTVALVGELVRLWAAGHVEKGREITRSGPYRYVRHPLYLGSAVMGLGFIIAARTIFPAIIASVYLGATLTAAIRTEEATLEARFGGEYAAYREGRRAPVDRPFSFSRVRANREPRTMLGFLAAAALLYLRIQL